MLKNNIREFTKPSEHGEAMPVAVITAVISSILLLMIASIISMVVQSKADSQDKLSLDTQAANIDLSLRSDITNATYITASAKLKQPEARLLDPTDITLNGFNAHIPASNGECKVIHWSINGSTISRDLVVYEKFLSEPSMKCDEGSNVVAKRNKVMAENINMKTPFRFDNQLGRELTFTHANPSLADINADLDAQLTEKEVDKLSDEDFNALNKKLTESSFDIGFATPAACVMNEDKITDNKTGEDVCPTPESDSVSNAWNSLQINKVSVMFELLDNSGESLLVQVEQNSPYTAETGVADPYMRNESATP